MRLTKVLGTLCSVALALCAEGTSALPAGAAAVKTVNVTSYGANGSDSADDTDAFQKALDVAKGSSVPVKVVVPSGRYYIGTPAGKSARSLRIYSNTTLQLNSGAVLMRQKGAPSVYIMETDSQKNITVSGGTFNGNAQTTTQAKGLVSFRSTDNITLSGVTFRNYCGTHCVVVDGAQGLTAANCTFTDFKPFTGSASAYTSQTSSTSYWSAEALHIDFVEPEGGSAGRNMKNISVYGCKFAGVPTGVGTHHVYDTLTADSIKIYGNTFTDCYYGCCNAANFKNFEFYSNKATNTPTLIHAENTRGSVYNNTLDNSSYKPGSDIKSKIYNFGSNRMELGALSAFELSNTKTGSKIDMTNSTSLEIYSNTIKTANYSGGYDSRICGIHGYYSSVINAHDNIVTGAPYRGIYVDTGKATLKNNYLDKCNDSVYVSNSTGSVVSGNTILNTTARAITAYTDSGITISDNMIRKTTNGRGITLERCTGTNNVTGNTVLECNGFGVYVITSTVNKIDTNIFGKGKTDAVTLNSNSTVTQVNSNHFFSNSGNDLYITGNAKASKFNSNVTDRNSVKINPGSTLTTRTGNTTHAFDFKAGVSVNNTCKGAGYTKYYCSDCSFQYYSDFTAPTAHTFTSSTVAPTYQAQGCTLHKCSVCGLSYKDSFKAKLSLANVTGFKNVAVSANAIKFTWNKVSGADGYVVYLYNKSAKKWERYAKTTGGNNVQLVNKLNSGEAYALTARAYKTVNGTETLSPGFNNYKTSTNPAKVSFSVTSKSKGAVTYTWKKVTGATSYAIYYKATSGASWKRVATVGNTKTSYTKTGLKSGTGYFTVRAYRTYEGKSYGSAFDTKSTKVK